MKQITAPHRQEEWNGYTLEEIQYRRAFVAARAEIEKDRLLYNVQSVRHGSFGNVSTTVKRVTSAFPMLDYALTAFNITRRLWNVVSLFRRRR